MNDEKQSEQFTIKTTGLTKTYPRGTGTFNALDSLDLNVAPGEFVAVMGASGSGKSTTLHLIAGLTRPTSGKVEIDGVDIFALRDAALTKFRRRRIGIVFQSYNLVPHLTAEENILFPLRADGRRLDICDQLEQYPDALSGGQQQRVALARAMATDPAVLLADEPTGNLDWTSSQRICEMFDRVNRDENRTVLVVTHEPAVAIWARRVVVLRDGKIVADVATSDFQDAGKLAEYYQEIARTTGRNES